MRDWATPLTLAVVLGGAAVIAALNLLAPPGSGLHVPTYVVSLVGKYLCFAILALAVDLVWGYAGILSLGHAAFFALGGYAMGMHLMLQIGGRGQYGQALPDFMVFLNWKSLPWYWQGFEWFPFALLMAMLVPGLLAAAFGFLAFRSRVTGVYLSIITQALTYALMLAFFRNDMGFGGNNGLTDFKELLGAPLQAPGTRVGLLLVTAVVLCGMFVAARALTQSRFGKVLVAVRDSESRTRFLGYRPERYKLVAWTLSAVMAGLGGALYVPQVGIINPGGVRAGRVHRGGDLGSGRRARHPVWRNRRRGAGQRGQDVFHRAVAGAVAVRAGRAVHRRDPVPAARPGRAGAGAQACAGAGPARRGHAMTIGPTADTLLYLDGVSVSFDGFRALNNLSLVLAPGEMRAVIGPNGAGKTTMMDVITGKTRPDAGRVVFEAETDLTRLDEPAIASLGIGRKFQKPTVFEMHTVWDNLLLALSGPRQPWFTLRARQTAAEQERVESVLNTIRLREHRTRRAGDLSHGQKQWLEIGMLLAQDPRLLLVDEPVAGMTDAETAQTADLLRDINRTRSVVVVEHDMAFVRALGGAGDGAARRLRAERGQH